MLLMLFLLLSLYVVVAVIVPCVAARGDAGGGERLFSPMVYVK